MHMFLIPVIPIAKLKDLDQVVVNLSLSIWKLVPHLGGTSQIACLIPLIEPLCHLEETILRDSIVTSICKILAMLKTSPNDDILPLLYEMTQRLYEGDEESESFFGRVTIPYYLPSLYAITNDMENRGILRNILSKLITDDFPMVRSSVVKCIPQMALVFGKELTLSELNPYILSLCADENESVKVCTVEILVAYAKNLDILGISMEERCELLNCIRNVSFDSCWRVRLAISKQMSFFPSYFPSDRIGSDLLACIVNLIQDMDIEVRSVAITAVSSFYPIGGNLFLTEFVPIAKMLLDDPQKDMRKGLADACVDIAATAGQEIAANYFNDILIKLVGDTDPMVRIRILRKLPRIAEDIPSLCIRLVTLLRSYFSDPSWRIRVELCKAMPSIVKYLGIEFFTDHFLAEYLITFKDDVSTVRIASCASIEPLAEAAGFDFIKSHVFPIIKSLTNADYLHRLAMLTAVSGLLKTNPPEPFHTEILQLLVTCANDTVPNIRLHTGQVLKRDTHTDAYICVCLCIHTCVYAYMCVFMHMHAHLLLTEHCIPPTYTSLICVCAGSRQSPPSCARAESSSAHQIDASDVEQRQGQGRPVLRIPCPRSVHVMEGSVLLG